MTQRRLADNPASKGLGAIRALCALHFGACPPGTQALGQGRCCRVSAPFADGANSDDPVPGGRSGSTQMPFVRDALPSGLRGVRVHFAAVDFEALRSFGDRDCSVARPAFLTSFGIQRTG